MIHGVETLGFVSLATRTTDLVGDILAVLVTRLGLPTFSALRDDPERMKRAFPQATEGMSLLASAIFLGLFATALDWVPVLHGEKWVSAVPLIQILCLASVPVYAAAFVAPFLRAAGHPRAMLPVIGLAGLGTLAKVLLTGGLEPIAIAYAWVTRVLVIFPLNVYLMRCFGGVPVPRQLRAMVVPVLLSGVMFAGVTLFRIAVGPSQDHVVSLLASAAFGAGLLAVLASGPYRHHLAAFWTSARLRVGLRSS